MHEINFLIMFNIKQIQQVNLPTWRETIRSSCLWMPLLFNSSKYLLTASFVGAKTVATRCSKNTVITRSSFNHWLNWNEKIKLFRSENKEILVNNNVNKEILINNNVNKEILVNNNVNENDNTIYLKKRPKNHQNNYQQQKSEFFTNYKACLIETWLKIFFFNKNSCQPDCFIKVIFCYFIVNNLH